MLPKLIILGENLVEKKVGQKLFNRIGKIALNNSHQK